ncbi:hypothetical protein niasHT_023773 [Heterodera trifolii]|uniref:Uncharacterized protein n=1 Tax=Heterodera trifolii TaxID=157864 RepID=A0ABD2JP03_9BILA
MPTRSPIFDSLSVYGGAQPYGQVTSAVLVQQIVCVRHFPGSSVFFALCHPINYRSIGGCRPMVKVHPPDSNNALITLLDPYLAVGMCMSLCFTVLPIFMQNLSFLLLCDVPKCDREVHSKAKLSKRFPASNASIFTATKNGLATTWNKQIPQLLSTMDGFGFTAQNVAGERRTPSDRTALASSKRRTTPTTATTEYQEQLQLLRERNMPRKTMLRSSGRRGEEKKYEI